MYNVFDPSKALKVRQAYLGPTYTGEVKAKGRGFPSTAKTMLVSQILEWHVFDRLAANECFSGQEKEEPWWGAGGKPPINLQLPGSLPFFFPSNLAFFFPCSPLSPPHEVKKEKIFIPKYEI